jgi:endogenous inhibitor of DNA gyrase (YacG/DUF329 family)
MPTKLKKTIMKNTLLLLHILLLSTFQSIAQNANWGTGLPATVNINGTSIEVSVFDPYLNQTRTASLSVGNNPTYTNNDGIVVAFGSYGDMHYATYDIDLQTWRTGSTQISFSNSSGTIVNSDGVVAGYGTLGDMEYATYDIELHTWKTGSTQISYSNSSGTIITSDGVLAGYGTLGDMEYGTYDVELHTWKTGSTQISYSNSSGTIVTSDGVLVGYGTLGDMEYATYDIDLQTWKTGSTQISSSNSTGTILTSDGVAVGYGTLGDMEYAIYDYNLDTWKIGSRQLGSAGSISLNSGTITYTGSSSGTMGYNPNTQNWGNFSTVPACNLLPVGTASSSWVFMRCMSIGAGTFIYSCGDGHQISRKQGWKKYNINNSYNADLNVSNGIFNSTCNSIINITSGIDEYNNLNIQIFPNPATDRIYVDLSEGKEFKMQLYNCMGESALQSQLTKGNNIIDISSLSSGIYVIRLTGTEGTYQQRLIKN